jgi:hypothetical protein
LIVVHKQQNIFRRSEVKKVSMGVAASISSILIFSSLVDDFGLISSQNLNLNATDKFECF